MPRKGYGSAARALPSGYLSLILAASIQPILPSLRAVNDVQLLPRIAEEEHRSSVMSMPSRRWPQSLSSAASNFQPRWSERNPQAPRLLRPVCCPSPCRQSPHSVLGCARMVIAKLTLVAAKALLDPLCGGVEALLRVVGLACGVQDDPGIEMHLAIGRKPGTGFLDDDLTRISSVEVLCNRLPDMVPSIRFLNESPTPYVFRIHAHSWNASFLS